MTTILVACVYIAIIIISLAFTAWIVADIRRIDKQLKQLKEEAEERERKRRELL